jgi:predicted phosphodiesterase
MTKEDIIELFLSLPNKTRKELRNHISDSVWIPTFGTFNSLKQCAGLLPTRYEKQFSNHIAKNTTLSTPTINSIKNELIEYADKFKIENTNRFKTVLTISDIHSTSADVFTINTFIDASIRTNPSHIVIAGDIFDFPHFSHYNLDPRGHSALDELVWVHNFLSKLRHHNPQAEITLLAGNHCGRLFKHLSENSPYFADILDKFSNITPSSILRLDELRINFVGTVTFGEYKESRIKKDTEKNHIVIGDSLLIGHYPTVKKHGIPSLFGHHHRMLTFPDYNYTYGSFYHLQLGAACIIDASYTEDFHHWTNGFCYSIVDTEKKRVIHDYCDTTGDLAVFGGKIYERS